MDNAQLDVLLDRAGLVFRGHVSTAGLPQPSGLSEVSGEVVTVEVAEVLYSSEALSGLAGARVVLLPERSAVSAATDEFIFFTEVLALAEDVLVREIGRLAATPAIEEETRKAIAEKAERPLRSRLLAAELIVIASVTGSRRLEEPELDRSEHDPEWWVARVKVEAVLKGEKIAKPLDVLFANSTDIAWYKSPKLHVGVRGILLLHRIGEEADLPKGERAIFRATDPLDLLPLDLRPQIERLLAERGER
jgi:hypothetical protein